MPSMVPSRTTQSRRFTRRTGRRPREARRGERTTRSRTGRCCARYGIRAHPEARSPRAGRPPVVASLAQGDEIGEQPIRARHALRELAKPREARVDEITFPVPRHEETALERLLPGITGGEEGGEALVPLIGEV